MILNFNKIETITNKINNAAGVWDNKKDIDKSHRKRRKKNGNKKTAIDNKRQFEEASRLIRYVERQKHVTYRESSIELCYNNWKYIERSGHSNIDYIAKNVSTQLQFC